MRLALAVRGTRLVTARTVTGVLADLLAAHDATAVKASNGGGESVANEVVDWLEETGTDTCHIARQSLAERLRRATQRQAELRMPG